MVAAIMQAAGGGGRVAPAVDSKLEATEPEGGRGGSTKSIPRSLSSESTDTIVVIIEEGPTEVGKVASGRACVGAKCTDPDCL